MANIYLLRHAQAGTRENYDVLSDLGRKQAALLARHLAQEDREIRAIHVGAMARQIQTAEIVAGEIRRAGLEAPEPAVDPGWNEFALDAIYRCLAPAIAADDPEFARDFEEMATIISGDAHATGGAVGRCDAAVVRAWINIGHSGYEGESWIDFQERIAGAFGNLFEKYGEARSGGNGAGPSGVVLVVTSATPIAILVGRALGLAPELALKLAAASYNAGITGVRVPDARASDSTARLLTFNSAGHLPPGMRTFR